MGNSENKIPEDLLRSLEATTMLIKNLLGDIKEHSTSLAVVKEKLESLNNNVDALSHVVRDGNGKGSLITRLALAEKAIDNLSEDIIDLKGDLEEDIESMKTYFDNKLAVETNKEEKEKDFNREKMLARLKVAAVAAPGILALALMIFKTFFGA